MLKLAKPDFTLADQPILPPPDGTVHVARAGADVLLGELTEEEAGT